MLLINRPRFTLLEILVVFLILSLAMALTGVKVRELYVEQRFLSDAQQIKSHLAMAQEMMLLLDTDVFVHFSKDRKNKSSLMWLEVAKPLEEPWERLTQRKVPLQAIHQIEFDHRSCGDLVLQFSLGTMSKGTLVFSAEKGKKEKEPRTFALYLPGYPSPIGGEKSDFDERNGEKNSQLLYPALVREELQKGNDEAKNVD